MVCSCQQGQSRKHASRRSAHWQYKLLWRHQRSDEGRWTQASNRHHSTIHAHLAACRQWPAQTSCKLVASLFAQTDDLEMEHVKQSVSGGAPIVGNDHPAIQALFRMQTAAYPLTLWYNLFVIDSQWFHSCMQMKTLLECCSRSKSLPRNLRKLFWVQSRSWLRFTPPSSVVVNTQGRESGGFWFETCSGV